MRDPSTRVPKSSTKGEFSSWWSVEGLRGPLQGHTGLHYPADFLPSYRQALPVSQTWTPTFQLDCDFQFCTIYSSKKSLDASLLLWCLQVFLSWGLERDPVLTNMCSPCSRRELTCMPPSSDKHWVVGIWVSVKCAVYGPKMNPDFPSLPRASRIALASEGGSRPQGLALAGSLPLVLCELSCSPEAVLFLLLLLCSWCACAC